MPPGVFHSRNVTKGEKCRIRGRVAQPRESVTIMVTGRLGFERVFDWGPRCRPS